MKYRMFDQAVSEYMTASVCVMTNVLTESDPPFERLFGEDFNGGFRLKGGGGGKYSPRYLH